MASNDEKAQQLIAEAQRKLSSSKGFFSSLFGGSGKVEDAIECYQRAANLFKMAKNWTQAASAFKETAKLHSKLGSRHEAAAHYIDAANCYKKDDVKQSVNCFLKAIEIYTDMGRFVFAAKHHQTIAELYENDPASIEIAVQHYEQAADYYRGEESNASANKCLIKVAYYSAQLEDYKKAIEIYEQVALSCLETALLKTNAKEYFFRAALCHFCVDLLNVQLAIERYVKLIPSFQDSREFKLLQDLLVNVEEQNIDGFTDAVKEYDTISRFDPWYTTILLRIKKQIDENIDLR